ncbi:uncharacterized protein BYT42DRAFT_611945 [Radiomyces spectabilis]|uniref:uncharacterized protein n=1 Tax=Radiomyces spectabilis TaxID=64574 RepID=UPI002220D7F2|nr:uncharacterized protein BYT42DRAFT_611945 [Radiomyces spectabilis]KAI8384227.1 hypothetical protein BYT42DRAFT_611945 [Radiomyces spectabilis]
MPYTFASGADVRIHPLSASPASTALFNPTLTSQLGEDVTTIFVVGFPDDMMEREFQNMFTFCPGFEAASLKWHCKDQEEDPTNNMSGKKQMIGFARFRTRLEALEAVEVLSGKKVDQEKGAVLKAEMAKKNLHIKRGSTIPNGIAQTSNSASSSTSSSSTTAAALTAAMPATDSTVSPLSILSKKMRHPGLYDSFAPLPSDLLSPADYKNDPFNEPVTCPTPTTPIFSDALFGLRSQSFDARNQDVGILSPPRGFGLMPPARMTKAIQESETDPYNYLSKSSPVQNDRALGTSPLYGDHNDFLGRMGSLSIHSSKLPDTRSTAAAAGATSTTSSTNNYRQTNQADQNPPCNTLYVGNLPPNTSEEELRQVFSKCRGYKRLCFRNKPQGPMCFVEFEDLVFATQALNELQGRSLTNSIKGGIRLSFSKNPLFIKPNKDAPTTITSIANTTTNMSSHQKSNLSLLDDRRALLFEPQL